MSPRRPIALAALLALAASAAGCGGMNISPSDPQYSRNGAPRAGEQAISPGNMYAPLGHDSRDSP